MEKILEENSYLITLYESGAWQTVDNLRVMLRELSANKYHLSKLSIEYGVLHNAVLYKHKGSLGSGKILAQEQFPELRMIRKIMEATDSVLWSMKSEISIIKKES